MPAFNGIGLRVARRAKSDTAWHGCLHELEVVKVGIEGETHR